MGTQLAGHAVAVTKTNETAATMLAARAKAEVEARAVVAMNRPRNIDMFRQNLIAACKRPMFADAAMYAKPIGGGTVKGLSIRFAEECARHYGNLDVNSFAVSEDDDRRVIKVTAVDLESNNSFSLDVIVTKTVERKNPKASDEVIRGRQNSQGQTVYIIRADDDALLVKQNALIAKAQREVILKHIPSDVKDEAEETIVATVRDKDAKDPEGEKKKILDGFYDVGVSAEQVTEFVGHPLTTLNPAELHLLRRVYRGVKDGEATWADVMADKRKTAEPESAAGTTTAAPASRGAEGLKAAVGKKQPAAVPAPPAAAAAPCEACHQVGTHADACPYNVQGN